MPEQGVFIVRCGRPIWSSHAGLSENPSRQGLPMPEQGVFIVRCGRPTWSSHAGLSENNPGNDAVSCYFHGLLRLCFKNTEFRLPDPYAQHKIFAVLMGTAGLFY
ncbi:MAG TPA: hypothetical protein ENK96_10040 [Desulfobulbaceae bacterium]|nr:hypothetical protein [Desulfobulbaceae bacterium]